MVAGVRFHLQKAKIVVKSDVDYVEVGRKTHELLASQGKDGARRYAAKIAQDAMAAGDMEGHAFWSAVKMNLTIR